MDSTHKTNRYDWRLFTLYVRDTYGCWNVGAHFFVSSEDADTVSQALTIIHNMCRWSPRYILSDHSNIEANGVKKAFPGISAGEQECEVLLCIVHKLCQEYGEMGLWARQYSPLLLQVTSTNSLESFHSELKKKSSSLHGAVHKIVDIDYKKRSEAESASFDFRIKKVSAYGVDNDILKEIKKFPFPFQQLIVKEACVVMNRLEKGKEYVQTEQQKSAKDRRIAVGELTERMRDRYWHVEEMGDAEKTRTFISMLEASVNPIISCFDDNLNEKM
ncbi:unnamed protein product [Rhizophagus irregularis]|nr:unnamed protein product [Rhizophagus irregularis]